MEQDTTHPDFGELEAYRTGDADAATAAHIAACAECRGNLEELEELVAFVRGGARPLPQVPQAVEKRILWHAHQAAARGRRQHTRQIMQRVAIAAGVLVSITSAVVWQQMNRSRVAPPAQLDVVDALALARRLAALQRGDERDDANHDGRIDSTDIQDIVRRAVALPSVQPRARDGTADQPGATTAVI